MRPQVRKGNKPVSTPLVERSNRQAAWGAAGGSGSGAGAAGSGPSHASTRKPERSRLSR